MGQRWNKFLLLMWKNWVQQYRHPIQTILEILVPLLFSFFLILLRSIIDPKPHDAVVYQPFCTIPAYVTELSGICDSPPNLSSNRNYGRMLNRLTTISVGSINDIQGMILLYSPNNSATAEVMRPFQLIFNVTPCTSAADMVAAYMIFGRNKTFAGIQFDDSLANRNDLGPNNNVKITLRFPGELRAGLRAHNNWRTNLVYSTFQSAGPRNPQDPTGAFPKYYNEGFLALQHLVSIFVAIYNNPNINLPTNISDTAEWGAVLLKSKMPFITMRRFPYAAWKKDVLLSPLYTFLGLFVVMGFEYTCRNTVKAITIEKERQLKESMKIMGLPNWLHWLAWFLKIFTYLMVTIVLMVVLLKVKWYTNTDYTVLTYASPFVLLIFLFFYICATVTFCFAISVFFSKANTAATVAGLAWFFSYAPYLFMQGNYDNLSLGTKLAASLGSNTAMAFGFQLILMYEGTGEGVQFDNIFKPNNPDDSLSLGIVWVMLVIDTIIYLLLALYVEAIFPGEFGIPQKWYFPFTAAYWCGQSRNSGIENLEDTAGNEGEFFEAEPKHVHAGIKMRNLRKVFGGKAAVRNLSLNMYEGQITVLLGHNGAGKTTTMSMLTGMYPPTSGTAFISGCDIRSDIGGVRDSLGFCPQHNILFDDLTVGEHLYFFSRLKGLKGKEIDREITKYVDLLELQPKKNSKSSTLSGGMKRKLSVGLALCGNSKVVMLDEPTSGMDPSARRALWDLILAQKTGRTVLLTTHFMDEADLLGDRIAILAGGELKCCGTSFFLKKKYGAGYHLIMDKTSRCDPEKVTRLLRKYIPNIEVHGNIGSELTYLLPENQSNTFEPMLRDLEQHGKDLGIDSYGISLTTLEEVFMKVGADHGQEEQYGNQNGIEVNGNAPTLETIVDITSTPRPVSSIEFLGNQIIAMTLKKSLSTIRSWILLIIHIFIPVTFLTITMIAARQQNTVGDLPAMPIDLDTFQDPVALLEGSNYTDYSSIYRDVVGTAYQPVHSIHDTIMQMTAETPITVRRRYIGGASLTPVTNSYVSMVFDANLTTYFNNDPYHTPAISLGLTLNTMYRKVVGCQDCSIEYTNHPMPYGTETRVNQLASSNSMGYQISSNLCVSMGFVSSFYVLFIVRERVSKSKHLQFISGVKVYIFWLTTLFWDFTTYLITIIALLITIVCFQENGFKSAGEIARLFLILIYFGWSMLPMMYISGYFFDVPSTGYTRMTLFSVFAGFMPFLIVQTLGTSGVDLEYVADALHWVFLAVPHYSLATGISDVYKLDYYNDMCNTFYETCRQRCPTCTKEFCFNASQSIRQYCEVLDDNSNYFKWESPGIGRNLLYSFAGGLILLIALLIAEYRVFSQIVYNITQKYAPKFPHDVPDEDSDVQAEKYKIRDTPQSELDKNYTMVMKDLTKYYKKLVAVNGLSLGVKEYECFGLLGMNGAGKTTTFKMLTGDVKISHGDAWVKGHSVKNQMEEVQKSIGYCPQFDALLDDLTARESLVMFSLLRGIPYKSCNNIAEKLASDFDYHRYLDKKVKELSGGNKRKLSASIALIGDSPIMFLDEPTTGMDPATKRYFWNALCKVRDSGKTIVLTSHSMEECEALCTRLAIMVNGNFKCLGSTQHLKNKFAEGYTMTIKVKKPEESAEISHSTTEPIEKFIRKKFPSAVLRERHEELLTYYITDKSVPWSRMFGILEEATRMRDLNIEDYSLGQSSLEQVFLIFSKHQKQV